jgi:hypothetical protein
MSTYPITEEPTHSQVTDRRSDLLASYGATTGEIEELLAYNQNNFDKTSLPTQQPFPLEPEPHIAVWETYYTQAQTIGVFEALRSCLVQLKFPIQAGISQTDNYRAATRRGQPTDGMPEATSLQLQQPDALELMIHPTLAGAIPVVIAGCRTDFIALVQALTRRNEPDPIPDSMGAVIIGGYNNWDRVQRYRKAWEAQQTQPVSEADWQAEFQRLIPQKSLYQDRFILMSRGNYSGVSAVEMGMTEAEWLNHSLTIRLEHECCHYFTRRVFGSMRNNALDELIADYQGIIAANQGHYRADWFLRFVGLEAFPHYREGGRLQNYRGTPPLSNGAFKILQQLVKEAAENLEQFNAAHLTQLQAPENQAQLLMRLTSFTLEDLADSKQALLEKSWSTAIGNPPSYSFGQEA